MINSLLLILITIVIGVLLWASSRKAAVNMKEDKGKQVTIITTGIEQTPTPTPVVTLIINEGTTPKGYTHFVEVYPKLSGEQGYVALPKEVDGEKLPILIMYYHGSTQRVTTNFNDQVMKNIRAYGAYFTERNMIFMASNQHGDNYGSKTAVEDSRALISWVEKKYKTSGVLELLGFSMGGMPALKHVILYPKEVTRIALLAPAQQVKTYTKQQIQYFRTVNLKVWHGTADVNVPYWVTEELKTYFDKYDTPIRIVTLKGITHWGVDTEYMKDIYEWFQE